MTSSQVPTEIAPGLHSFEKVVPSGWGLNMFTLTLPDGGLLVHSPTWLGEGTFEAVEKLGTPRILFAPNHFHHMSLPRYRKRWPEAAAVASRGALPRLGKKGHDGLQDLDEVAPRLPEGVRFLVCEGTKNGEAWLRVPGEGGPTLVVCDGFFHMNRPVRGAMGVILRALKTAPGLCIGQTFPWLALRDKAAYARWALATLERERPRRILCSHGEPLSEAGLPDRLSALVRERLG